MMIQNVLCLLTLGMISSIASADVVFNNKPLDSQFNYPLKHSEILIVNNDKILSQNSESNIGSLYLNKPEVIVISNDNYKKEIFGRVSNKIFSDKLTLVIYENEDTGKIEKIESKTILLKDYLKNLAIEIVKTIKIFIPIILPVEPNLPNTTNNLVLSEQDVLLNNQQCIQYNKSIKIEVPTNLSTEGGAVEIEGNNGKKCIKVTYKPISSYSISFNDLNEKNVGNNLLSSACREVDITVKQSDGREYTFSTVVSDSTFTQKSSIPMNGTMTPGICTWKK